MVPWKYASSTGYFHGISYLLKFYSSYFYKNVDNRKLKVWSKSPNIRSQTLSRWRVLLKIQFLKVFLYFIKLLSCSHNCFMPNSVTIYVYMWYAYSYTSYQECIGNTSLCSGVRKLITQCVVSNLNQHKTYHIEQLAEFTQMGSKDHHSKFLVYRFD